MCFWFLNVQLKVICTGEITSVFIFLVCKLEGEILVDSIEKYLLTSSAYLQKLRTFKLAAYFKVTRNHTLPLPCVEFQVWFVTVSSVSGVMADALHLSSFILIPCVYSSRKIPTFSKYTFKQTLLPRLGKNWVEWISKDMRKSSIIGNNANISGFLISSPSYEDNIKSSYQTNTFSTPVLGTGSTVSGKELFLYSHGTYMSPRGKPDKTGKRQVNKQMT